MKMTASLVAAALCSAAALNAQTTIKSGHLDLGIAYEDGAFDLHLHDEENDVEYAPNEAILQVGSQALTMVPGDPRYAFLGAAGSPVFLLPQVENPDLIFLGVGAEEIAAGLFQADQLTLSLRAIIGPGEFAGYSVDGFGGVTTFFNTRDGIGANDRINATAGGHSDINWAFSAPGTYRLSFEAGGTLAGGGAVLSGPVEFQFSVVPEPSTWALLGLGGLAFATFARRKF